jgi:hypothetical protein
MNPRSVNCKSFLLALAGFVFLTSLAGAQAISPRAMVSLTGAVAEGGSTELVLVGGNISNPFVVPPGKFLVLTDIVISPQVFFDPQGHYAWQVNASSSRFSTALSVTSTAEDASSFQIHLTTGMVFQAGSEVRVSLVFGSNSINVSAFGYLASSR